MCKFLDSQYCSIDLYGSVTPFDYCSFVESSEVGECEFSFKIVLAVLSQLNFHMNLDELVSFCREVSWNFDGCIESVDHFVFFDKGASLNV